MTAACPCGRALPFERCCGRFISSFDDCPAPDAESLMRSRYCAFVFKNEDYLLATWHESTRPNEVGFDEESKWIGLDVRDHRVIDDTHAEVEFIARYRIGGRAHRLHERSRFVHEGGRWYYVDGETK